MEVLEQFVGGDASLARLKVRQKAAKAELDTAQAQLDEQARATYMGGPEWLLGELVGGANPPDVMRRLPMQKAALEARAAVVSEGANSRTDPGKRWLSSRIQT